MKLTRLNIVNNRIKGRKVFAVISDLHGCDPAPATEYLRQIQPDFILAPGDIFEMLDGSCDGTNESGFVLLGEAAKIAPTFFCAGNHELGGVRSWSLKWKFSHGAPAQYSAENRKKLTETGAYILENSYVFCGGMAFGGLESGLTNDGGKPRLGWLNDFCRASVPKILLCHHPEYYKKYLSGLDIDLIVSGHAHGGQWRFFGRGVFAPGQGIFPKYTAGVYDNRLVVSTGLKSGGHIPRIFNEPEVVEITVN